MEATILAISPGTRHMGLAIMEHGELIDSRVCTFKGHWSERKLRRMLRKIARCLDMHGVKFVAIRTPNPGRFTPEMSEVLRGIYLLVSERRIDLEKFMMEEIRRYFLDDDQGDSKTIGEALLPFYPELTKAVRLEKESCHPYYSKEFEAVGMAHIVMKWNRR